MNIRLFKISKVTFFRLNWDLHIFCVCIWSSRLTTCVFESSVMTPPSTSRSITGNACVCSNIWNRSSSRDSFTSRCCWKEGWSRRMGRSTTSLRRFSAGGNVILKDVSDVRATASALPEVFFISRSIQKLEEMNVSIDHRGDEVMTHLGQQWNGLTGNASASSPRTSSSRQTPDKGPPRDKPGGVISSTPLSTGNPGLPSLSESPVPTSHR